MTAEERATQIDSLLCDARQLHLAGEFLDAIERATEAVVLMRLAEEERETDSLGDER